jgi:hypothetical protein
MPNPIAMGSERLLANAPISEAERKIRVELAAASCAGQLHLKPLAGELRVAGTTATLSTVRSGLCPPHPPIASRRPLPLPQGARGNQSGTPSTRKNSSSCGLIGRSRRSPVGRRLRNHLS